MKLLFLVSAFLLGSFHLYSQSFQACICTGSSQNCNSSFRQTGFNFSYQAINDTMYKVRLIVLSRCDATGLAGLVNQSNYVAYDTCNFKIYTGLINSTTKYLLDSVYFLPDGRPNRSEINIHPCSNFPTQCTSPYSANNLISYKEIWLEDTLKLPEKCGLWKITISFNTRDTTTTNKQHIGYYQNPVNSTINNPYLNYYNGYLECGLNNLGNISNHCAVPSNQAPIYVCENQPFNYNPGYIDPDGDSLVFTNIRTMYNKTDCAAASSLFITLPIWSFIGQVWDTIPFQPPYSLSEPFSTNNTFQFNTTNGNMSFTPTPNQHVLLTNKVDEYRHGVWVGSSMRDFSFVTIPCTSSPNVAEVIPSSLVNLTQKTTTDFEGCLGQQGSACFYLSNANPIAQLMASSNIVSALPGSFISFTPISGDSIKACITWTPTASKIGNNPFTITVIDTSCSSQGANVPYNFGFNIVVKDKPMLANNYTICTGDSIQLLPSLAAMFNFSWSNASGFSNYFCNAAPNCANIYAYPASNDVYYMQANSQSASCIYKDTATIFVVNKPKVMATDTLVCGFHPSITLKASITNANVPLQYLWLPLVGIIGSNILDTANINTSNTTYYVQVTDSANCFQVIDTAHIQYDASFLPIANSNPTSICVGDTVQLNASGGNVTWKPIYNISNTTISNPIAWPDTSVVYTAQISSLQSACVGNVGVPISATLLRADAGNDTTIFDGELLQLGGIKMLCNNCQFFWWDSRNLLASNNIHPELFPMIKPPGDTYFRLRLVSQDGACFDEDSVFVHVICNGAYIPNAFYPNSHIEANQKFGVHNSGLKKFSLVVYNRLGEKVFYSDDCLVRWDGTFKSKPCPMDTYYYRVLGECEDGVTIEKKGDVILIR